MGIGSYWLWASVLVLIVGVAIDEMDVAVWVYLFMMALLLPVTMFRQLKKESDERQEQEEERANTEAIDIAPPPQEGQEDEESARIEERANTEAIDIAPPPLSQEERLVGENATFEQQIANAIQMVQRTKVSQKGKEVIFLALKMSVSSEIEGFPHSNGRTHWRVFYYRDKTESVVLECFQNGYLDKIRACDTNGTKRFQAGFNPDGRSLWCGIEHHYNAKGEKI